MLTKSHVVLSETQPQEGEREGESPAIETRGLTKRYGERIAAVDGFDHAGVSR